MAVIVPIIASAVVSVVGTVIKGSMQKAKQAKQEKANKEAEYEHYLESKAEIEENNRVATEEHEKAWGSMQRVAYTEALSHMTDARERAHEFGLLAQEYQIEAGKKAQAQVASYAKSGALVRGSALQRLAMTAERGLEGAARLREQGVQELQRGHYQYQTTLISAVEPELVLTELPPEVDDPNAPTEKEEEAAPVKESGSVFDYRKETDALGRPAYTDKGANPYYGMSKHGEARFRRRKEERKKKREIEKMAEEQRKRGNTRKRERRRDEEFIKRDRQRTLPPPPTMRRPRPVEEDLDAIGLRGGFGY